MNKSSENIQARADEILQEIRIVLPGTEALLGFQFVTFFNPIFQALPQSYKYVHLTTLILSMLSTVLLVSPVAFQQIGEDGKLTNRFIRFARNVLNAAMFFLLLSLTGNVFMAAKTIKVDTFAAVILAQGVLSFGAFLWYAHALRAGKNGKASK